MPLNVEVFYHWERWHTMIVDEDEREAGDHTQHATRTDAIKAAKKYGLPVYIYTKASRLLRIKKPPH